ncbi:MAG: riboflavin synthase [Candidatus Dormibacteria bacterium]
MFSGIVEELGEVAENAIETRGRLRIAAREVLRDVAVGDSIAVNGCCLTVVAADSHGFTADVMPETARRTSLGILERGDPVNLEAALAYGDRVGGHMVTGHVDAVGTVCESREEANARWTAISAPPLVIRRLVDKGCVAVDGVSLTVVDVLDDRFTVSLIPHTVAVTTARRWQVGRQVNLEVDLIARYVERSLAALGDARTT